MSDQSSIKKHFNKAVNIPVTNTFLNSRETVTLSAGYNTPKWIEFCRYFLKAGFKIYLYEARQTVSKYITLKKENIKDVEFKVRFSNHKPIKSRELGKDCDFFVGKTHTGIRTTHDAKMAALHFFNSKENNDVDSRAA